MDSQQQYADAMRAFDAYYGTRRRVFGVDWPAKRYAEHRAWRVFMKVAALCAKEGRDVERFVTVVLEHSPKNSDAVVPNDLIGKHAEQLWAQHRNAKTVTAQDKWAYHVRILLQVQDATGQSDEAILTSSFNSFPAWFRVFYPDTLDDNIVSKWGEEALAELKGDRDTVRFLRAAMPAKVEELEKRMGVVDGLLA